MANSPILSTPSLPVPWGFAASGPEETMGGKLSGAQPPENRGAVQFVEKARRGAQPDRVEVLEPGEDGAVHGRVPGDRLGRQRPEEAAAGRFRLDAREP